MPRLIRYLAYLAYFPLAAAIWLCIFVLVFGLPLGEPACRYAPAGCPPPDLCVQGFRTLLVLSIVPLTVLGFVMLRRWLHRLQGMQAEQP